MAQKHPFFSIIIPTYNRTSQLSDCLKSLACLDYPQERFEVIVVDDGGDTPPDAVVASFDDRLDVTLLTQPNGGAATARNHGATQAKGEFLVFIDDDCAPPSNWLGALATRLASVPNHAIGGRTLNALPNNPFSVTSQAIIDVVYTYYNSDANHVRFFASNNLVLPTDIFRAIGGFDVTFRTSEDRELYDRWLYRGYKMTYAPEILIYHAHELTLRTFWRQHFSYGRGAFRFRQGRARRDGERIRLEPKSFYLNLLRYPFLQVRRHRVRYAVLLVISQVASGVGFLWESIGLTSENRDRNTECV